MHVMDAVIFQVVVFDVSYIIVVSCSRVKGEKKIILFIKRMPQENKNTSRRKFKQVESTTKC
jgi:hypothetical protein